MEIIPDIRRVIYGTKLPTLYYGMGQEFGAKRQYRA